jgi:hypothetical protein
VSGNAEFVLSYGDQTIHGLKTLASGVKLGSSNSVLDSYHEEDFWVEFELENERKNVPVQLTKIGRMASDINHLIY